MHRRIFLGAMLCVYAYGAAAGVTGETFGGRNILVYLPSRLPASGARALVVVLHGGLGNAQRIESKQSENALNLDVVAEQSGFIVAYLNGTPVTRFLGSDKLGWNAGGGCCGLAAKNNVDDIQYITGAVAYLTGRHGIDRHRVYGIGHSNGAMMTLRLMCETDIYTAAVSISGPLNIKDASCAAAHGKRILAIHGAKDENVPIAGGQGAKGLSGVVFNSEERSRQSFMGAGASYELQVVGEADHKLENIDDAIERTEGLSVAQKAAQFFGLLQGRPQ